MVTETAVVHCIADDAEWLDSIVSTAESPVRCLSWQQFSASPMEFASGQGIAVARLGEFSGEIDHLLGCLCRTFPRGVVVELASALTLQDQQFFAHGFRKLKNQSENSAVETMDEKLSEPLSARFLTGCERCFEYRLRDYKAVPHWLNARFWAHPERFHL